MAKSWVKPAKAWSYAVKPTIHTRGPKIPTIATATVPVVPGQTRWTSVPQRILAAALLKKGLRVELEVPFAGGRSMAGGQVWDIWLPEMGLNGTVVRVDGNYWHTLGNSKAKDDAQSIYLHLLGINVIDVWTNDILKRLNWVLQYQIGFLI